MINFFEYEKVRDARRASVIELKRRRRVSVGTILSLVFENRETVLFQIQEMCRAERIAADAKVREELDVYNALLPGPWELSATLFIEIEDMSAHQARAGPADGDRHRPVRLAAGGPGVRGARASSRPATPTRRRQARRGTFRPLPVLAEAARAFREAEVHLVVDHPAERARARLSDETRAALLQDFTG